MSEAPLIETGWQEIAQAMEFCCDYHRDLTRSVYFVGAMNALTAATTWQPGQKAEIVPCCLTLVCDELTIECLNAEREAEGAAHA